MRICGQVIHPTKWWFGYRWWIATELSPLLPGAVQQLREEFQNFAARSSEELLSRTSEEVHWIEISAGEVLIFNQKLPNGNRVIQELKHVG